MANLAVQQEQEEQAAQSFTPYWNFSMIGDEEVLQSREKFMKAIQTFLQKFSRYPFGVMPKVLLIAWEIFSEIKHAFTDKQYQPDEIQELMCKLLEDCYLFRNPFSSTTMGDENPIRTLGDYSKPSHEGYRNTIELPAGNNVVPLRSNTIRMDRKTPQRYPDVPTTSWRISIRSMDSFQGLTHKIPSSWHRPLAPRRFRKMSAERALDTIEELARYEDEGWNDPNFGEEWSLNYKNSNIEQLLGIMEHQVDTLMKDAISLIGKSEDLCGLSSNTMHQLPPEPLHHEAFKSLIMNFILDQDEKVCQLKEYMCVIGSDFMQLSLEVVE
nr:MAK10-like protein [Tanacetum cinerariifolium]